MIKHAFPYHITADTFFVSDHHLGHEKILNFTGRPFKTIQEMEDGLVAAHNAVVGPNDLVYFLGDFALINKSVEELRRLLSRFNGIKVLIMGNHDGDPQNYLDAGFVAVFPHAIVFDNFIISHEPAHLYGGNFYNIHGHQHGAPLWDKSGRHFDCSVEALNYTPIKWSEILERMKYNEDDPHCLIVTRGIPGSGKSTWIKEWGLADVATVIESDEIRLEKAGIIETEDGPRISQLHQEVVWREVNERLCRSVIENKITVLDATNIKSVNLEVYAELAKFYRLRFQIVDFSDIPLEVAKERNQNRLPIYKRVPEHVIDKMYAQINTPLPEHLKRYVISHSDIEEYTNDTI